GGGNHVLESFVLFSLPVEGFGQVSPDISVVRRPLERFPQAGLRFPPITRLHGGNPLSRKPVPRRQRVGKPPATPPNHTATDKQGEQGAADDPYVPVRSPRSGSRAIGRTVRHEHVHGAAEEAG